MKGLLFFIILALSSLALSARADFSVDTENLQLRFSPYGDLLSVRACLPACGDSGSRSQYYDSYRGLFTLNRDSDMVFELERRRRRHARRSIRPPNEACRVRRQAHCWRLAGRREAFRTSP